MPLRMQRGRKHPHTFGRRRRRRHRHESGSATVPVVRPMPTPSKCSCVLEATDGLCRGRLLAFPNGIARVAVLPMPTGRLVVRPVTRHPRAIGYYRPDHQHAGCARFVPCTVAAA